MFKVTITCVVVNLIIVVSCLATPPPSSEPNETARTWSYLPGFMRDKAEAAIAAINHMLQKTNQLINRIAYKSCTVVEKMLSSTINRSIHVMLLSLANIHKQMLAVVKLPSFPNFSSSFLDVDIQVLQLTNIVIVGFDKMLISKLDLDVCQMSSEIEVTIPTLEMTATYTLKGTIKGASVSGSGKLKMIAKEAYLNVQSQFACEIAGFSDDTCKFLKQTNKTLDIAAEKVTVNVDGVKYERLSKDKINNELNKYIKNYLDTDKVVLIDKMAEIFRAYKNKMLTISAEPVKPDINLNKQSNEIPALSERKQKSSQENVYLRILSTNV